VQELNAVWMARQVAGDNRMPAGKPAWAVLASARVSKPQPLQHRSSAAAAGSERGEQPPAMQPHSPHCLPLEQ